ncbi:MAG: SDR family oxidoreductase [Rhodospirillales bacterium]
MPHLFAFGLGFSALALAGRLKAKGWAVSGTCRSSEKADRLRAEGFDAVVFDPANGVSPDAGILDGVSHVLSSIAPDDEGDPVLRDFADALGDQASIRWAGYLSTTGVYGDSGGAWVDESSPTEPSLARARRRVTAENAWLDLQRDNGLPVHVFRLAGIYGPGRSALDAVRAGRARRIDRPGHLFGRIHVDDIAAVLEASIDSPAPGEIYNVSDDEPAAPADVTTFACELLGVEPPPLISFEEAAATMSPMGRTFWEDNRKVSNRRIREELGVELAYPTYREGLQAIHAQE